MQRERGPKPTCPTRRLWLASISLQIHSRRRRRLATENETNAGTFAQHSCPCQAVGAVRKLVERRGFKERWCRTVDYAVKIRVNPDQKGVDLNVKHSMVRVHRYPQACRLNPRRVAEPL